MLKQLRQTIVKNLWLRFYNETSQIKLINEKLNQQGISKLLLDHFAIIDLPGPTTGITPLAHIFTAIGYKVQGQDYLAEKQNDFLWLAEADSKGSEAVDVLPQIVVADFRLDEMPLEIKKIIEKYSSQSQPLPLTKINQLVKKANDLDSVNELNYLILKYLQGRDWPLPTKSEFYLVQEFNELLAWVLIFGRRPNHFTLSIHLMNGFETLSEFNRFIEETVMLKLNYDGGVIKGNTTAKIAQSSTIGDQINIQLCDGEIAISSEFIEFIWRYPRLTESQPKRWEDYFTGFIAQHADHVIESLYIQKNP